MRSARRASWPRATWAISIRYRATAKWSRSTPTAPRYGNTTPWQKTAYTSRAKSPILRWTPTARFTGWRTDTTAPRRHRSSMRSTARRVRCSGRTRRPTPRRRASPSRRPASVRAWSSSAAAAPTARSADSRRAPARTPLRPPRPTAAAPPARSRSRTAW